MDIYKINKISDLISDNPYVGRGIIIGKTPSNNKACIAYFIMGRSANSRNRVFKLRDEGVYTEAFDPSKLEDPSLIIYAAVKEYNNKLIVTNGDQTDTVYNGLKENKTFAEALRTREFEPDFPNFTPRISGMLTFENGDFTYQMSILKSSDASGKGCNRFFFEYIPTDGLGSFIHTYVTDGNPIPTFQGEPERVAVSDDIDDFTNEIWTSLNEDNKISLYVRYIDLENGSYEERLINKNR